MEYCVIGTVTKTACNLETFSKNKRICTFEDLNLQERASLSYRIKNLPTTATANFICHHHKCKYLDYYSRSFTKCCDPFKRHRKPVTDQLRVIDLQIAGDSVKYLGRSLIPGDKLCRNCLVDITCKIKKAENDLRDGQNSQVRYFHIMMFEASEFQ